MDLLRDGCELATRARILALLQHHPGGIHSATLSILARDENSGLSVVDRLTALGEINFVEGFGYMHHDDPWFNEPKQLVMCCVVLQLLLNKPAGYSRRDIVTILRRHDAEIDSRYTNAILSILIKNGAVIKANGTHMEKSALINPDGTYPPNDTASVVAGETYQPEPATVYRLSAARWLKDTSK